MTETRGLERGGTTSKTSGATAVAGPATESSGANAVIDARVLRQKLVVPARLLARWCYNRNLGASAATDALVLQSSGASAVAGAMSATSGSSAVAGPTTETIGAREVISALVLRQKLRVPLWPLVHWRYDRN